MEGLLFTLFIIGGLILVSGIRIINQYERGIVLTLGKYSSTRNPGLNVIIPVIQTIRKVDIRSTPVDVPKQEVITKDNVTIGVDAVVYFRAVDPAKAVLETTNYTYATSQFAQAALRDVVGNVELDELLGKREEISLQIKNIVDAETNYETDPLTAVILGFNVMSEVPAPDKVKVITHNIIYSLLDDFEKWQIEERKKQEAKELETVTRPAKLQILKGFIFRQTNPAIVGIEVLGGTLKNNEQLMNKKGEALTTLKGMQHEKKAVQTAEKGKQLAASLTNVTMGRQLHEDDVLYTVLSEHDFRILKEYKQFLTADEKQVLKEIAQIMREQNPVWGV